MKNASKCCQSGWDESFVKEGRDLKNRTPSELNQAMELERVKIWGCKNIKGATSLAKSLGLAHGRRTGLE